MTYALGYEIADVTMKEQKGRYEFLPGTARRAALAFMCGADWRESLDLLKRELRRNVKSYVASPIRPGLDGGWYIEAGP